MTGRKRIPRAVLDAFWAQVTDPALSTEGPCLEWPGARNKAGYGLTKRMGENIGSRAVWVAVNGPIPDGMLICHTCDNPPCCRPGHLFVGDHKANSDDMIQKGRGVVPFGEQAGMSTISSATVVEMRTRHVAGESVVEIARSYGVNPATVSKICRGLARRRDGGPLRHLSRRTPLRSGGFKPRAAKDAPGAYEPCSPESKEERTRARRQREDERIREMRRLYLDEGLSTTEVGKRIGIDASRVSIYLRRAGVQMRPRCRPARQVDSDELRLSYEAGASLTELARENGKTTADITRAIKAAGGTIRRAGRPKWSADEAAVRPILYKRSGEICEGCGRAAAGEAHHRKNRSQGGKWTAPNLMHMCAECHRWVTGHPAEGHDRGWAVKSFEDPAEVPVLHAAHGWVRLTADGGFEPAEPIAA